MRKVVVTGIGAVTSLGNSFHESWVAVQRGLSGIAPLTRFDVPPMKWKMSGELKGFDAGLYLSQKEMTHLDPFVQYAVAASFMAAEDAGLIKDRNALSVMRNALEKKSLNSSLITHHSSLYSGGVIIGSSRGGITTIERELEKIYASRITRHASRLSPYLMPSTSVNAAASYVAQKLGIKGHCLGISNACSSGANAIGEAYRLIKFGYADMVFAGGSEAPLCRLCVEGYGVSGALSKINDASASRPFDKTRDGFVLAEGASVLVLEDYEMALKRGAKIYGEIIGYGNTTDAFHQTRPSAEGEARAIRSAMEEGVLLPEDVDYINAHGTSTPLGDKVETEAIKLALGKRAYEIPISSVKSMTGHMLAASGAFEAAVTLISIYEGIIPPTINLKTKDPECDLNYITETMKSDINTAISNSFGFGGVNAVLVFRRVRG
ncbi:MAG: beta-ketoacyl synthase N-terminal-like domain-containing protein [Thermodesulfovibrionales bacterium]|nr:beta-ketoacyl synthase N-terminal-like domain-containing protein [Thermodesulfovibrionales bacterium]